MGSCWLGLLSLLPVSTDTGWPSLWDTSPPTGEAKAPETATTVAPCCIPACLGSALQLSLLEDTRGERWVLV